jgi:hypothetical protein
MIVLLLAVALSQAAPSVNDVSWMAGCWAADRGGRQVVEAWIPPAGGTMMGVSRTVVNGKTVEWEFLVIRAGANGLQYVAKPSGQAEATFTATHVSSRQVDFEDPAHDFPQRIIYARDGDALTASLAGQMSGQARRLASP